MSKAAPGAREAVAAGRTGGAAAGSAPLLRGAVHSWDLSTNVDGPGTRFVVFLAGCPLRCLYCHNPDTWTRKGAVRMTVDEVVAEIGAYRRFIAMAGGGVTVSGGEPLLQPRFVEEVLTRCRELGLHTAVDTAGPVGHLASETLLDLVDLVLLDIKSWGGDRYRALTGADIEPTLQFARRLGDRGQRTWLRFVVVPGMTDTVEVVEGVAAFAASLGCVERVDVLPVHRLAAAKYEALNLPYTMTDITPPDPATLDRVRQGFAAHGLQVV